MRKISALFLILVLTVSLCLPIHAQQAQHQYSSAANSGVRHEVCTTLEGTTVDTYYIGEYTFDILSDLKGDALLQTLRTLMTSTHTYKTSYDECRDLSVKTDCENGDGETINLLYSSFITNRKGYINDTKKGWNREHVWPKSLGGFNTTGAGSDLHHIRPTDSSLNGTRGNDKYGEVVNGREITGTVVTNNALGGTKGGGFMEPLDNVKGDVARICMYVYVRYGGELSKCSAITNVFQSVDVLLQWHEADPVDTWEMGRNEVVYAIQGNRNVFIDYPELAWLLFDREIPEDAVTPSGSMTKECAHTETELVGVVEAVCNKEGYTGDTCCADCGLLISNGAQTPATGEHTMKDTISNAEYAYRSCMHCGYTEKTPLSAPVETPDEDANSNTALIVVAVIVPAMMVLLVVRKKKQ